MSRVSGKDAILYFLWTNLGAICQDLPTPA